MRIVRLRAFIARCDLPLLLLALIGVAIYLAELRGMWVHLGVQRGYESASLIIDLIFVADLVLKVSVLGRSYIRSPWFVIDLISALPLFNAVISMAGGVEGLRFVRSFRFFRVLRTMRLVRVLGVFRAAAERVGDTPEGRAFNRALTVAVLVYTGLFLAILTSAGNDPIAEFYLVLGSVLGMVLILAVMRYQIRDLTTRQVRALLNIALPDQVARHYIDHPEAYNETVHMPATILFTDLTGFTHTVESLGGDLDRLKRHLEGALDAVVEAHRKQDLIIDKFIGDGVLSFRGGNLVQGTPADHAYRVVRAALDSVRAVRMLADPYFNELKLGGASSANAIIGAFGTSSRLSYTILGDDVNLASRLEASCGQLGASNVFCDRTRRLTQAHDDVIWRRLGSLIVKGRSQPQPAFEALDAEQESEWLEKFHTALEHFDRRRFDIAAQAFKDIDAARTGGDGPSRKYADLCRKLATKKLPDDWSAALNISK